MCVWEQTSIDPVVFKKLFDAWRRKQMVELVYRNPKGESQRIGLSRMILFTKAPVCQGIPLSDAGDADFRGAADSQPAQWLRQL